MLLQLLRLRVRLPRQRSPLRPRLLRWLPLPPWRLMTPPPLSLGLQSARPSRRSRPRQQPHHRAGRDLPLRWRLLQLPPQSASGGALPAQLQSRSQRRRRRANRRLRLRRMCRRMMTRQMMPLRPRLAAASAPRAVMPEPPRRRPSAGGPRPAPPRFWRVAHGSAPGWARAHAWIAWHLLLHARRKTIPRRECRKDYGRVNGAKLAQNDTRRL